MLHHLEELAARLGIEVRYEPAAGRVGVGRLRGQRIAVIDAALRVNERLAALASILAGETIDGLYVPPAVRQRLDRAAPLRSAPSAGEMTQDEETGGQCDSSPPPDDANGADPKAGAE